MLYIHKHSRCVVSPHRKVINNSEYVDKEENYGFPHEGCTDIF
jgi:hypothetical protein